MGALQRRGLLERAFFAGEHLSHLPAWQKGAGLSARRVVNNIHS